jgi:1-phosphatidylinositol-4-phosphate 5-kinase
MRNIIGVPKNFILRRYDVKGSSKDRQVLKEGLSEREMRKLTKTKILKDLDLVRLEPTLALIPSDQEELLRILVSDSEFFKDHGLMDYSLLIAVVLHPPLERDILESGTNHVFPKQDQEDTYYHVGIIDYLQTYDAKKRFERTFKQFSAMNSMVDISASPPDHYATRFQSFISRVLGQRSITFNSSFGQNEL